MPNLASKRAIMILPHSQMLGLKSVAEWAETFFEMSGQTPTEIVLPAVELGRPTFESVWQIEPKQQESLGHWVGECRALLNQPKVWGLFNISYAFLEGEDLHVLDQHGITLDNNACITNPIVREIHSALVNAAIDLGIDGIVLDVSDIFPNTGSSALKGLQNTCFCQYCLEQIESDGFRDGILPFIGSGNPFRIVLNLTETGAANIPIRTGWYRKNDIDLMLAISRARGFVTENDATVRESAEILLRYTRARVLGVARMLREAGKPAKDRNKTVAIILGDSNVDLTTMTDLTTLQEEGAADEFWTPELLSGYNKELPLVACEMLFGRALYGVNSFFEVFESGDSWATARGPEFFLRQLTLRARNLGGNKLTRPNVFATMLKPNYSGFVGVPLSTSRDKDVNEMMRKLTERGLGQIVSRETLRELNEQLQIGVEAARVSSSEIISRPIEKG